MIDKNERRSDEFEIRSVPCLRANTLLRFNVLFYIVYWKYLWIFGYLISARFHGCEVSHVAILVGRSCG